MNQQLQLICTTTDTVPGYTVIGVLGIVFGAAYSQNVDRETGNKQFFGLKNETRPFDYSDSMKARENAAHLMLQQAEQMGANAVIGVRFDTITIAASYPYGGGGDFQFMRSEWGINTTEYFAYGTAVVLE